VQQLTRSFRTTVSASLFLGAIEAVGGLVLAFYVDVYPAATIVLAGIGAFAVAAVVGRVTRMGH